MTMHSDDLISRPVLSKLIIAAKSWWAMMLHKQIEDFTLRQPSQPINHASWLALSIATDTLIIKSTINSSADCTLFFQDLSIFGQFNNLQIGFLFCCKKSICLKALIPAYFSFREVSFIAIINERTYAYCSPSSGTECENDQLE